MKNIKLLLSQNSFLFLAIIFFFVFNFNYIFGNALIKGDQTNLLLYPAIYYLKNNLLNGNFPFYTEKIFSGYPIYQNPDLGYFNPVRLILTLFFPFEKVLPIEYTIFSLIGIIYYFKFLREKKISESSIFFSHFIFIYNFQFLSKFDYQSFIYITMLIPLVLYLTDKFFINNKSRFNKIYLISVSIIFSIGILYGNYPSVFNLFLIQFIYILTNLFSKINFKNLFFYNLFVILLAFSFSLFALFPHFSLIRDSSINLNDKIVNQNSNSQLLVLVNLITPKPVEIRPNETFIYQGFTFLTVVFLGFIYLKNIEFKRFFIVIFTLFIVFSNIKYPFFASVFSFSLAILGASIIHKLFHEYEREDLRVIFKNLIMLLLPISILIFTIYRGITSLETIKLIEYLRNGILNNTIPHLMTSLVPFVFLIILLIIYKFTHRKALLVTIPIITILEFMIFANTVYTSNLVFKNLINNEVKKITNFYTGKRVVFDNNILGSQTLFYENWNVYGYTSYKPDSYETYLKAIGLNSAGYLERNYFLLADLKVNRVIDENYNIHGVSDGQIFDANYETLSLNENHKIYKLESETDKSISTYIKYDKNIDLMVNNQKFEFPKVNRIFYEIELNKGTNTIEFIYQPRELYFGFILGLFLSIFTIIILKRHDFK